MRDNEEALDARLGTDENARFVVGVFIVINVARHSAGELLDVFACDAAHLNWGSFMVYSKYGLSSDKHNFAIGHAFQFGNENYQGWSGFLKFVKFYTPIDQEGKTLLCDQEKGLRKAMRLRLTRMKPFCCSFHRKKNIQQQFCKSVVDLFTEAVACVTMEKLNDVKAKYIDLTPTQQSMLNKLFRRQ